MPKAENESPMRPLIRIVDDDPAVRDGLSYMLLSEDLEFRTFGSAEDFLNREDASRPGCIVLDVKMPGLSGTALHAELRRLQYPHPIIFLSGHGSIEMAVAEVKRGAFDFLEKPIDPKRFLYVVRQAIEIDRKSDAQPASSPVRLTDRERQVIELVLAGRTSSEAAEALELSIRTVENYRAAVYRKYSVTSLQELKDAMRFAR